MNRDNLVVKYWYLWLAIILLPISLYWLLQLPWGFNNIGGDNAPQVWLNFLSSYSGAIISSITAYVILFITYKQNKKQIKYQQAIDSLIRLKEAFVKFNYAFDYRELSLCIGKCKNFSDPDYVFTDAANNIAILRREMESAYIALELSFSLESVDRTEINKEILDSKNQFVNECNNFLKMNRGTQCKYTIDNPDRMRMPSINTIYNYINNEQLRINKILL